MAGQLKASQDVFCSIELVSWLQHSGLCCWFIPTAFVMKLWKIGSCIESKMEVGNSVTKCGGGAKCPWLLRTFIDTFLNSIRNHRQSEWDYQS
jgi:hypothetical protein